MRTLAGKMIGRPGSMVTTVSSDPTTPEGVADRMMHIEHIAKAGAPLPADWTTWLLMIAREAIAERDSLNELVSQCADVVASASEILESAIVARGAEPSVKTDYNERTMGI